MPDYIQVYSRGIIHPLKPKLSEIRLEDIAHSLSLQCRFAGHIDYFYSVAQHSVMVSKLVPPEDAMWGLLHDAAETYLLDIPSQLKQSPEMAPYRQAESNILALIAYKFNLKGTEPPPSVHHADLMARAAEANVLMSPPYQNWTSHLPDPGPLTADINFCAPHAAEKAFLRRFLEIEKAMKGQEWR